MRYLLIVLCAVALAAFGCGSSSGEESTTPVEESTEEPADTVEEEEAAPEETLPATDVADEGEEDMGDEGGDEEDYE